MNFTIDYKYWNYLQKSVLVIILEKQYFTITF